MKIKEMKETKVNEWRPLDGSTIQTFIEHKISTSKRNRTIVISTSKSCSTSDKNLKSEHPKPNCRRLAHLCLWHISPSWFHLKPYVEVKHYESSAFRSIKNILPWLNQGPWKYDREYECDKLQSCLVYGDDDAHNDMRSLVMLKRENCGIIFFSN